jgi:hypothetical protein
MNTFFKLACGFAFMAHLSMAQQSAPPTNKVPSSTTVSTPTTKSPAEKPLPDIATLFHDVEAHQKQLDSIRRNYMYRSAELEEELDGDGKVKHTKREEREIFFVGRRQVSRLLKKDGVELSAAEQKKEQERVDKEVKELQKKEVKRQQKEDEGKHADNEITVETLLRICRFTDPRRISFNGRDTIVFEFSGNPDFKAHGMAENAMKKLSGKVWIDEVGREVVRMEVQFDEAFKIAGGLFASVHKGSHFAFEQALVNDEVWLPTYEEANVVARVLVFKGIREHSVSHFSDYRKFRVASKVDVVGEVKPQ